jgi:hypothetical protein
MASNFGFPGPINSCPRRSRAWNSSGVIGCTRSPSGFRANKLSGVCVCAGDCEGAASVIAEAAAAERRKLRRESSCVTGSGARSIGKQDGWWIDRCQECLRRTGHLGDQARALREADSFRMTGATRVPSISMARSIFSCGRVETPIWKVRREMPPKASFT